jgi:glycerophosphoryl diester phosphodiesterase
VERIAHRGAKREFPENTLPAFARAFERGAGAIELDVHATRDGVVVVHHDDAVRNRAGGSSDIERVHSSELIGVTVNGVPIPTLQDVLAAVPSDATAYVEIKGRGIEALVADVIAASATACAVHSFDHACVARMRQLAPAIPRGILLDAAPRDLAGVIDDARARDVWPEWMLIDRAMVELVHAAGGRVIAWTVNDRDAAQRLVDMGVDGLCSDDVRLLDGF